MNNTHEFHPIESATVAELFDAMRAEAGGYVDVAPDDLPAPELDGWQKLLVEVLTIEP